MDSFIKISTSESLDFRAFQRLKMASKPTFLWVVKASKINGLRASIFENSEKIVKNCENA